MLRSISHSCLVGTSSVLATSGGNTRTRKSNTDQLWPAPASQIQPRPQGNGSSSRTDLKTQASGYSEDNLYHLGRVNFGSKQRSKARSLGHSFFTRCLWSQTPNHDCQKGVKLGVLDSGSGKQPWLRMLASCPDPSLRGEASPLAEVLRGNLRSHLPRLP